MNNHHSRAQAAALECAEAEIECFKSIVVGLLRDLDRIKNMAHNAPSNTPESELWWIESHATQGIKIAKDRMK